MHKPLIKAVWFDMDGTILTYKTLPKGWSSWGAIGWVGNIYDQMEIWIDDFINKRITDDEIWGKTAQALKGISYAHAQKVLFPEHGKPPYNPNIIDSITKLKPKYHIGIISGGIELVAEKVREDLGLAFQLSNTIGVSNNVLDGTYKIGVPFFEKFTSLKNKANELGFDLSEICFVGDSINDMECFEHVGLPITYNPRYPEVAKAAKGNIIKDFSELLPFIQKHTIDSKT